MRGVAAVCVLIFHIRNFSPFAKGYHAVDFFFLLSGYVIGLAYQDKLVSNRLSFGTFLIVRAKRLYPMLLAGMLLGLGAWGSGVLEIEVKPAWIPLQLLALPILTASILYPLNDPVWSVFFESLVNVAHGAGARLITRSVVGVAVVGLGVAFLAVMVARPAAGSAWGFTPARLHIPVGLIRCGLSYSLGLFIYLLTADRPNEPATPWWIAPAGLATVLLLPNLARLRESTYPRCSWCFPPC
jgi:peptidoglycan/LPS O-acetylase OafA/YrhL